MPVHQFPVLIHVYTVVISLPMVALLMFLMIRLSKSCVRSSTQLSIHCWAYILYFLTGFGHAFYVLVNWRSVGRLNFYLLLIRKKHFLDYLYNEPAFQLTIVLHLSFVILLPWAVLLATVDRCISLRLPTYYSAFNGESIRFLTIILSICMILGALCYIYKLVIRVDAYGSCSLVECLEISQFIHMFIVYKVFFGCVNFFVSSVFIYLFWNYQRRGRGLDKIKNNLMLIISVFEFIFNVMPPLAYYILDTVSAFIYIAEYPH